MKYKVGTFLRYNNTMVMVVNTRYNEKLKEWFYEVENKKNDFKAWVSEYKLTT